MTLAGFDRLWKDRACRLVLLAVCVMCPIGFTDPPDLSAYIEDGDTVRRLEKGALVVFKDVSFPKVFGADAADGGKGTLVLCFVAQSADTAWAILHDFNEQHTFMPNMDESELVSQDGEVYYVRFAYDLLWTNTTTYLWGTSDRDTRTLVWRFDPENSDKRLKELAIFWRVQEYGDGRTLMAFFQHIRHTSRINAIGQKLLMSPRATAKAVRKRVNAEGKKNGSED